MPNRQADSLGDQSGGQVAEISARHRDDVAGRAAGQGEVVEHLRQQAAEIDRVGRRQPHVAAQVVVGKRPLDQRLAVVERPLHGQRRDVVAERRHLRFLHVADLPFRIEHDDARVGHAVKGLRHRAARVAGRRDQNRQGCAVGEVVQQPRLHAGADVLERQGRPVKQLQRPRPIGDLDERNRETRAHPARARASPAR